MHGCIFIAPQEDHPSPSSALLQAKVDATYKDQTAWTRMSILSTAGSGFFSSDRTIREYAKDIWKVEPCRVPAPQDPVPNVPTRGDPTRN